MTVVAVDGFDLYSGTDANTGVQAKWTSSFSSASMQTGRFGGQCLRMGSGSNGNNNNTAIRALPSAAGSVSIGVAIRVNTWQTGAGPSLLLCSSISAGLWGLRVNSGGQIEVGRVAAFGSGTMTSLGTSAGTPIVISTWHYVEIETTFSATVGTIKVYVDGVQVINLSGLNNTASGATTMTHLGLQAYGASSGTTGGQMDYDDLYITDTATKLGERRVETIYPDSDVAQGFARSAGSTNYTLVDEAQVNGDTDYVQGSSVGDVDTYGFGNLGSTPTTIDAVQVSSFAEKTDAASRSIALQVKSGATTSDGSNYALAASYGKFERILTTDPNTSVAWTASGVNAVQGGPKVTV